jgi:putative colanic acid biosynthesis UDP-glucose lipid carrier transferase
MSRQGIFPVLSDNGADRELRSEFTAASDRHATPMRSSIDQQSAPPTGVGSENISKVRVLNMPRDVSLDAERNQVDPLDLGAERLARSNLKRLLDIFGALAGLMVLAPLLLLVAVLIVLESPGSPIFRQRRSGYRGAPFVIYKFRTMRVAEDGPNVVQARREDSRVTLVGSLLRRTSVDELPQLLNVLKGEMSLVGPRPHALAHDDYYGARITEYQGRFRAKPGLTGLAQVSGLRGPTPDVATMAARIEKDLDYIREWSILLDLRILCQTGLIFAFHPAAY